MRPLLSLTLASIRLQALARRFIVRKLGARNWRKKLYKKKRGSPNQLNRYLAYLDYYSRRGRKKPDYMDDGYSTWCAVRLQAWWRMVPKRRHFIYLTKDMYIIAAIQIQNAWQNYRSKAPPKLNVPMRDRKQSISRIVAKTRHGHARVIQNAWRTHCNIRVYRYFKDLVLNKLKGAPVDLLRCIVPGEADILDKAAGVHVRFRLGGHIFPPKIYYKIFTHRPLCDLNAFAPRNYANEGLVAPTSLHLHPQKRFFAGNKREEEKYQFLTTHMRVGGAFFDATVNMTGGTKDWYRRDDNNYWRPISHEASDDPMFDQYKSMTISESTFKSKKLKKSHYHYSKLRRQEDILRERKQKRRDWMLKAYMLSAGMKAEKLCDESDSGILSSEGGKVSPRFDFSSRDPLPTGVRDKKSSRELVFSDSFSETTENVLEEERKGCSESPEFHSKVRTADVVEDDDLLKWSLALDYEAYNATWSAMAVSMPSDYNYTEANARPAALH